MRRHIKEFANEEPQVPQLLLLPLQLNSVAFLHQSARQMTLSCLETECALEQFHPKSCKQRKCMRAELSSFDQNMLTLASTQVVKH